jgi:hypothetical protein
MAAISIPDEGECYLWAILSDPSGLDQAEFMVTDETTDDGCFRAWPFQWPWWRNSNARQIEMGSRSSGKSLSVRFRALAFPFIHAGQEMVVTAPEGNHLDALTDNIENVFINNRLPAEMLTHGRNGIKHRPFHMNFRNGARIMGRIPQRDGKGIKGCSDSQTPILTTEGHKRAGEIAPGDTVWTHEGWREVTSVQKDTADTCYEVNGQGSWPITVSWDHRFYGASNLADSKHKRDFSQGMWWGITEDLLDDQFYWATPTEFDHLDVVYPDTTRFEPESASFWWLVGLYLADGYLTDEKGTRGRVNWVAHPDKARPEDHLDVLGLKYRRIEREHSSADVVEVSCAEFNAWLLEHFGKLADGKRLPAFVLSMKDEFRSALLDGYLAGDGHWNKERQRWQVGTASEFLAHGLQLLAQTLGLKCSGHCVVQPKVTEIMGVELKSKPKPSYRFGIYPPGAGKAAELDDYLLGKVKSVTDVGPREVVNIITDAHSYLSGSIMSHNIHPIWLELDEGQDYPEAGWLEIIETVKRGESKAQWRAHGVTRGIRDKFYEYTQPDSGWEVHHYPAMYRPTWDDDERAEKVQLYGHKDSPDYRRNVLGLHGDAQSPLFVLHRLMECCDADTSSEYNINEYWECHIDDAAIRDHDGNALMLLDPPPSHNKYKRIWIGADIGYTQAPTAIMIFAEHKPDAAEMADRNAWAAAASTGTRAVKKKVAKTELKLIGRIMLKRVAHENQVQIIMWLADHYRPQAFAMDKTGLGLPLFQDIQNHVRNNDRLKFILDRIKGYNFSEKLVVDFDDVVDIDENDPKGYEKAEIKRNVLEYCVDEETQCFTREGWRSHHEVLEGDEILALDPISGRSRWDKVLSMNRFDGEREVLEVGKRGMSSVSTLNHRWFTHHDTKGWEWRTTETLVNGSGVPNVRPGGAALKSIYSDDFVRTVAWAYTEGWWGHGRTGSSCGFGIAQSAKVNPGLVDEIRSDLLGAFGDSGFSESEIKNGMVNFWLNAESARGLEEVVSYPEKEVSLSFLSSLTQDQLDEFIRVTLAADGSGPGQLLQKKRHHAEAFAHACVLAGRPVSVTQAKSGMWLVQILKRDFVRPTVLGKTKRRIHRGVVWCPTTESGTWLARRSGTIYYTGNSSDCLRSLVDDEKLRLPWDRELIGEFKGQTFTYDKSALDMYGRKKTYSAGSFHSLDGCRMAALAWKQASIEEFFKSQEDTFQPSDAIILDL